MNVGLEQDNPPYYGKIQLTLQCNTRLYNSSNGQDTGTSHRNHRNSVRAVPPALVREVDPRMRRPFAVSRPGPTERGLESCLRYKVTSTPFVVALRVLLTPG